MSFSQAARSITSVFSLGVRVLFPALPKLSTFTIILPSFYFDGESFLENSFYGVFGARLAAKRITLQLAFCFPRPVLDCTLP